MGRETPSVSRCRSRLRRMTTPMPASDIADTLRRFNRKERHLVIQNCLRESAVNLSPGFCDDVTKTLGPRLSSPIRRDSWWATDYHLDWLIGALAWHGEIGSHNSTRPRN